MVSDKRFDMLVAGVRSIVSRVNERDRLIRFARFS